MLALVSHPSPVADAGAVDTFSREAVLFARFRRGCMSDQYKVKQNVDQQVSADTSQIAVDGQLGSKNKEFRFTVSPRIHFPPPSPPKTGALRSTLGESLGYLGCFNYNEKVLHIRWVMCILKRRALAKPAYKDLGENWLRSRNVS